MREGREGGRSFQERCRPGMTRVRVRVMGRQRESCRLQCQWRGGHPPLVSLTASRRVGVKSVERGAAFFLAPHQGRIRWQVERWGLGGRVRACLGWKGKGSLLEWRWGLIVGLK